MTGSFLPALNLCTSASDSGGREELASIQPPEKAALALVIFFSLHTVYTMLSSASVWCLSWTEQVDEMDGIALLL